MTGAAEMTVQRDERPGWGQRVILSFCVAVVAFFVEYVVIVASLFVVVVRLWPPELFPEQLVWGVGALVGCAATVLTFICTRPTHRLLGSLGICLAFAVPWLADQGLHPYLTAALAGVIRMATPTRQVTTAVRPS